MIIQSNFLISFIPKLGLKVFESFRYSTFFIPLEFSKPDSTVRFTFSSSGDHFTRFVNMLINDTTFLLDESVDTLKNIRDTQELMANTAEWEKLPREGRTSRQRQLATDERQCKSYLTLASETVDMLHYLTLEIKEPFLQEARLLLKLYL